MTESNLENIVALLEEFLHSGTTVLNQLKLQRTIHKQNFNAKTLLENGAQVSKEVFINKQIEDETEMVLEDELVDLFGFEEVHKETNSFSKDLEIKSLSKISIQHFKDSNALENEAPISTKVIANKQAEYETERVLEKDVDDLIRFEEVLQENVKEASQISQDRLNRRIDCTECELQFQDDTTLNKHFRITHNNVTIGCNHCEFTTSQPSNLNFHKLSQHKTSCNQCDYTTPFIGDLNAHVIRKHGKFKCEKCNYKSANMFSLRSHDRSMHEGIKVYCDECSYKCVTLSTLKVHKRSKHENIYYKCNLCAHKASRKDILRTHVKTKHNK